MSSLIFQYLYNTETFHAIFSIVMLVSVNQGLLSFFNYSSLFNCEDVFSDVLLVLTMYQTCSILVLLNSHSVARWFDGFYYSST